MLQWQGGRDQAGAEECRSVGQEEGENAIYNVYFMKNNFVPTGSEEAIKELL